MLDKDLILTFKGVAKKLKGSNKREFAAEITNKYLGGSARKAERKLGWNRDMVVLGQKELSSQIVCLSDYQNSGRKKMEDIYGGLTHDIASVLKNEVQTDPKFRTGKQYCKMTAKEVCGQLSEKEKYKGINFKTRTMSTILNRLGYSLKKL
jgi:transposase